jgi:hypothetical protein
MHANATPEVRTIALQEGLHLKLADSGVYSPRTLFMLTAACSAMLGDKPVHCAGFLPGVSLLVHVLRHDPNDLAFLADSLWAQAQPHIEDWIEIAGKFPCLIVPIDGAGITLALDRRIALDKGVMQVDALPIQSARGESSTPRT